MTGLEKLFFLIKSQAFIKFLIVILVIMVNVLLVEKPAETLWALLINILKHSVFVLLTLLVFSPVLTPWLVGILWTYFTLASTEALMQMSFGIVLLSSQSIIISAKNYFKRLKNKNGTKWKT